MRLSRSEHHYRFDVTSLERGLGNLYATWLTVGVALLGQALWFSWQYGTLGQRVTDLDRRELGSEAVDAQFNAVRNQIEADTRRLDQIEHYVPDRMLSLTNEAASVAQRLASSDRQLAAYDLWRAQQQKDFADAAAGIGQLRQGVEADARRIDAIEKFVPDRTLALSNELSAITQRLISIDRQLAAYDLWRAQQDKLMVSLNAHISNLDARLQAAEKIANGEQQRR